MDHRKNMVRQSLTMQHINTQTFKVSRLKHHLSYGVWVFGAFSLVLLSMPAPSMISAPIVAVAILLGALYWRWTYLSNQIRDARITDYVLTDVVDLSWLEWARNLEPEVDMWLDANRPDRRYTARDFQQAYWRHAYYWADLPRRAPYYGDVDRCHSDLEVRRQPQRLARARQANKDIAA